jgi:hypothetical protein
MSDKAISTQQKNRTDVKNYFDSTASFMDETQQMNFLFALKRGLPDLKQKLSKLDNAQN